MLDGRAVTAAILIGLVLGLLIGGVLGLGIGDIRGTRREQEKALEAKAARWEVDPGTGVTAFVYRAAGPATPEKAFAGPVRGAHSP